LLAGWGGQALAQGDGAQPLTQRQDNVQEAIATPVGDLNIRKIRIPPVLQRAVVNPYQLETAERCDAIAAEVGELDAALGADRDVQQAGESPQFTPAGVLKTGIEAMIPFRGLVRHVSGAVAYEKRLQTAIEAGFARRGFLKGKAFEMNCAPPASPAWYRPVLAPPPRLTLVESAPPLMIESETAAAEATSPETGLPIALN
jgi:hypothetical protein